MLQYPLDKKSLTNVCFAIKRGLELYESSNDGKRHQITKREAFLQTCDDDEIMVNMLLNFATVFDEHTANELLTGIEIPVNAFIIASGTIPKDSHSPKSGQNPEAPRMYHVEVDLNLDGGNSRF